MAKWPWRSVPHIHEQIRLTRTEAETCRERASSAGDDDADEWRQRAREAEARLTNLLLEEIARTLTRLAARGALDESEAGS